MGGYIRQKIVVQGVTFVEGLDILKKCIGIRKMQKTCAITTNYPKVMVDDEETVHNQLD